MSCGELKILEPIPSSGLKMGFEKLKSYSQSLPLWLYMLANVAKCTWSLSTHYCTVTKIRREESNIISLENQQTSMIINKRERKEQNIYKNIQITDFGIVFKTSN